ncbi:MAG: ribonuclease HI [Acidimicrobiia bacterium]
MGHPKVVRTDENAVNIFTDGSSFPNPRRGGMGIVLVAIGADGYETPIEHLVPGHRQATNQQMELRACHEALKWVTTSYFPIDIAPLTKIVLHTDSQYVEQCYTSAKFTWRVNGWLDRHGNPVDNAELWKQFVKFALKMPKHVFIEWHPAHKSWNPYNAIADKLARQSANGPLLEPLTVSEVRRKITDADTVPGSIGLEGQILTLRIVGRTSLRLHKAWKYRCEVTSLDSPYFGNMADLYAEYTLRPDHQYEVQLSGDPTRSWIERVIAEVERTDL